MTDAPKLLTEAEADRLFYKSHTEAMAELRERGLIAPEPVDALLFEAREVVIATTPQPQRNFDIRKAEIRRGWKDDGFCVQIALAALRRGMELAKPELTREMVGEIVDAAMMKWKSGRTMLRDCLTDAFHAALTEGQSK